jgi:hypothetical protein
MDILLNYDSAFIFVFPGFFPDLNKIINSSKDHWSKYKHAKGVATDKVTLVAKQHLNQNKKFKKHFPLKENVLIAVNFYERNKRRDPDGFVSGAMKCILDGFQKAGVLTNDGWNIRNFVYTWAVDAKNPRVEVFLFPGETLNFIEKK